MKTPAKLSSTRATSALAALALPLVIAGSAWLAPQALAASDSTNDNLSRSIDLSELEARSLERFSELDTNNNGLIDTAEYATGAKAGGRQHKRGRRDSHRDSHHKPHQLDPTQRAEQQAAHKAELFARLDTDNNGVLSGDEFAQAREIRHALRKERHLQHRFEKLDDNGDTQLSLTEFQQRLEKMRALDTNNDGTLTRAELHAGKQAYRLQHRQHSQDANAESSQG